MSWRPYSLHFKQIYADGYRYLDRCGEFILAAKEHEFMPDEIKVTGGQLSIPERFIQAIVGPNELTLRQDFPSTDFSVFQTKCVALADLAGKLFGPLDVQSNGFAQKYYWPVPTTEEALAKSLRFKDLLQDKWAKELNMISSASRLDFNFTSGNMNLHVVIHAVTFENVTVKRHNAPFGATREQKNRVKRLQEAKGEFPEDVGHALLMEIDLKENDPPIGSLAKHFELLQDKSDTLIKLFA